MPRSIREQRNHCRHFTGLFCRADGSRIPLIGKGSKERAQCRAGVYYDEVRKQGVRMVALPCLPPDKSNPPKDGIEPWCDKCSFKSDAELDAEEREIRAETDKAIAHITVARAAILKEAGLKSSPQASRCGDEVPPPIVGFMLCPICKAGPACLGYRISNYNGHIHAKCSTDGCVSWME